MTHEDPSQDLRVVVETLDLKTLCITGEVFFVANDLEEFCKIVGIGRLTEAKNFRHIISSTQLSELKTRFEFDFVNGENEELTVRCWHWLDELPYKIHTCRELTMMLEGSKPLSIFNVLTPEGLEDEVFAEAVFDEYVEKGVFMKRQEFISANTPSGDQVTIRTVLYALKGEEWRINAFILLKRATKNIPWNDSFERIEGALLGYSERESDAYTNLKNSELGHRIW